MSDRPVIRAIVAWWPTVDSECIVRPKRGAMTLEDAAYYADLGFLVLVDPFDLEELTRWEQTQRIKPR